MTLDADHSARSHPAGAGRALRDFAVELDRRPSRRAAPGRRPGVDPVQRSAARAPGGHRARRAAARAHVSGRLDPEAAALLAIDGSGDGTRSRSPRGGTAESWRRRGVGRAARCWRSPTSRSREGSRNQGIGRHLLAALEDLAASRECEVLGMAAPTEGAAAALLAATGWRITPDPDTKGRRRWIRPL